MCLSIKVNRPESVLAEGVHEGLEWVVTHNNIGYRCGYVRVPKGHPWHGKEWSEVDCEVHGGITFAEPDVQCDKPGEDDAWWIGFDCAHGGDAPDPALTNSLSYNFLPIGREVVRDQEYVESECKSLCKQAAEMLS